jgi:hypothetical protein
MRQNPVGVYIEEPKKIADSSQHFCEFFPAWRRRPRMHDVIPVLNCLFNLPYELPRWRKLVRHQVEKGGTEIASCCRIGHRPMT